MKDQSLIMINELRDKGYTDAQILESLFTLNPDNEFYLKMLHCLIDLDDQANVI